MLLKKEIKPMSMYPLKLQFFSADNDWFILTACQPVDAYFMPID